MTSNVEVGHAQSIFLDEVAARLSKTMKACGCSVHLGEQVRRSPDHVRSGSSTI